MLGFGLHRGPEAPYFPSHLTYPNIKRDTHGNSKGMKVCTPPAGKEANRKGSHHDIVK